MADPNPGLSPARRWRWLRRLSFVVITLVLAAVAWDVASYDARPWLADYQRLKRDMAQGYANLDWIAAHRQLDLAALDRETTVALNRAHSRVRAFLALRGFVERFGDPHLRLEPAQTPAPSRLASSADAATEPADPAAGKDCESAGYEEDDHGFTLPFAELADWYGLPGTHFPAGRFGDVGVLRIARFGEQRYLAACRQVFRAGIGQRALQLRVRAQLHVVVPPSGLPAGSKTDASFEALVSPEHHALALTGSRLGELAPTLTIEFQGNAVRRFAWRPEDGRLDLHPAAALPAQP